MIIVSPELRKFVVEPWMELEPFDTKLIKEIQRNHPYKILLWVFYKYNPSYSNGKENDADPNSDGYDDNILDFYFNILDDYNRYGIAFQRKYNLFPGNKLGVIENEDFEKRKYHLVDNHYNKKVLLFNNVKTIDLNKHDRGKKPLTKNEKQKRDMIKKQTNKKLQVAMMDPIIYNDQKLFKDAIEDKKFQKFLIRKFNTRMNYNGLDYFLELNFD